MPLAGSCQQKLKMLATSDCCPVPEEMDPQMTNFKNYGASVLIELQVAKQQEHMNTYEAKHPIFM